MNLQLTKSQVIRHYKKRIQTLTDANEALQQECKEYIEQIKVLKNEIERLKKR